MAPTTSHFQRAGLALIFLSSSLLSGCFDDGLAWKFKAKEIDSLVFLDDGSALVGWASTAAGTGRVSLLDANGKEVWRNQLPGSVDWREPLNWYVDKDNNKQVVASFEDRKSSTNRTILFQYDWKGNATHQVATGGEVEYMLQVDNSVIVAAYLADGALSSTVSRYADGVFQWTRTLPRDSMPKPLKAKTTDAWWLTWHDAANGVLKIQKFDLNNNLVTDLSLAGPERIEALYDRPDGLWVTTLLKSGLETKMRLHHFNESASQWDLVSEQFWTTNLLGISESGLSLWFYDTNGFAPGELFGIDKNGNEVWRKSMTGVSDIEWLDGENFVYLRNNYICSVTGNSFQSILGIGNSAGSTNDENEMPKIVLDVNSAMYVCDGKVIRPGTDVGSIKLTNDKRVQATGPYHNLFDQYLPGYGGDYVGILDWKPE